MKALSVKRPWSEMIARGQKTVEVRSWRTDYRGPLLICTSTNVDAEACEAFGIDREPRGVMCCVVELVTVGDFTFSRYHGEAMCDVSEGDYAWHLSQPRRVAPVKVKGRLRLFDVADELIEPLDGPRGLVVAPSRALLVRPKDRPDVGRFRIAPTKL